MNVIFYITSISKNIEIDLIAITLLILLLLLLLLFIIIIIIIFIDIIIIVQILHILTKIYSQQALYLLVRWELTSKNLPKGQLDIGILILNIICSLQDSFITPFCRLMNIHK